MPEQSFTQFLQQSNQQDVNKLFDFALDTLNFANAIHLMHWSCEKGFHHTHLEDIYDTLRDFADTLVELSLAKGSFQITGKSYTYKNEPFSEDACVAKLEQYIMTATSVVGAYPNNRGIQNIFDDMIAKLEQQIGLIKNFG